MTESHDQMTVCVGVVTRERRSQLQALLESFRHLDTSNLACTFVIVENSDVPSVGDLAEKLRSDLGLPVVYDLEPQQGIAFARNRALDIALGSGARYLAFIDDDERVTPDWLNLLVTAAVGRELHLVGGPVLIDPACRPEPGAAREVWDDMARTMSAPEALQIPHRVPEDAYAIATNNWIADLNFVRIHGLRFDENTGFGGGEDTRFFFAAKAKGARTGWCADAVVLEHVQPDRLSLTYQFRRERDRSLESFAGKHQRHGAYAFGSALASALSKGSKGVSALAVAALLRRPWPVAAFRDLGFAAGRLKALTGARSSHYEKVSNR